ncbi:MAG: hypothetical protein PVG83_13125 [Acidimicrobiia bacterium]|jgi:MYXO-CTERM domain-containing protein
MRSAPTRGALFSLAVVALLLIVSATALAQQLPEEITDPAGDTIDFAGNPVDGPDIVGVTAVEVTELAGENAWDLVEDLFDFPLLLGDVTILPDQPGPLLSGAGPFIYVRAYLSQPLPDAEYCQIVIAFRSEGIEHYTGAAGDPNNGNDTSLDLYVDAGQWTAGRTEYRDGSFSFVVDYNEIAAGITDETITVVFPRDAVPDGVSWQIWVICGDAAATAGRDFTDLGSFQTGFVPTFSLIPPTTTTNAPETTQTTMSETVPTTVPPTTITTTAAEEPSEGGIDPVGVVVVGLLTIAGLAGAFLYRRRRGPCDCELEKAAYDTAHARYAEAQASLDRSRQLVDDWQGRHSETQTEINGLDALRPRRPEFSEQSAFETADSEYRERRRDLKTRLADIEAEQAAEEARADELEQQAGELWDAVQAMLAVVRACWQRCFDAPFDPGPIAPPPGTAQSPGDGETDGDDPRDTAPPGTEPECTGDEITETVERTGTFAVPVDGMIRVSLSTDRGPLDDLNDIVSGNPVADMIAEFLSPEGSLELSPDSLTGANARRWQDAIEEMRTLSYSVLKREIYVNIAFDVEDVTVDCVRTDECKNGKWVLVGHEVEEKSRVARTVKHTWAESDSGGRPLGATMTVVNREMEAAIESAGELKTFISKCG